MNKETSFEILCVTMRQKDFSKIESMNVRSNVLYANQSNCTSYEEHLIDDNHVAKMITTNTKGVGINRNISLLYSTGDICLLSDDDVRYVDDVERIVLGEFDKYPKADVIIFNVANHSDERPQKTVIKTYKLHRFSRKPFGAVRIAFKRLSVISDGIFFNTLFGGGCLYKAGEDSLFIDSLMKKGKRIIVSNKTIGETNTEESTWFDGYNASYFYSKGAFLNASKKKPYFLWALYYSLRTSKLSSISFRKRLFYIKQGRVGFLNKVSFEDYQRERKK